eukprot:TRINITY_DN13577_c0_g1_i1.p1 TRINITY_DN13577_c0_g1~~TRINITY_DN13577_c0_g1_i1.p1  ORF type:complete len:134 (-),score=14.41 TRINITY_DN13577_c0_g1_i1:392-754(-)
MGNQQNTIAVSISNETVHTLYLSSYDTTNGRFTVRPLAFLSRGTKDCCEICYLKDCVVQLCFMVDYTKKLELFLSFAKDEVTVSSNGVEEQKNKKNGKPAKYNRCQHFKRDCSHIVLIKL